MHRTSTAAPIAVALVLVALAGCTPADCDPSRADLFSGIGCATSGSYGARQSALQGQAVAAQANEQEQQARAAQASADEAKAAQDLQHRRIELALLDGRLKELRRQIALASQRQGVDQAALRQARSDLAALEGRRTTMPPQPTDAQLHALDEQTRSLSDQMSHGLQ